MYDLLIKFYNGEALTSEEYKELVADSYIEESKDGEHGYILTSYGEEIMHDLDFQM